MAVTPTAGIEPVGRESTASIIAGRLRTAIGDGTLPPGSQLGEADLARRFDVSRGTLREAMQRLVAEGLLRGERHRGLFVRELASADVLDIYVTRNAIEQAAARLILRGDPLSVAAAAARLEEICSGMREAAGRGDHAAVALGDARYHETLVLLSGSPRLARVTGTLLIETRMCIRALQDSYPSRELPASRLREHDAILQAIRDGDEERVLALIDAHMEAAAARLAPGLSLHGPRAPAP
jgi:DNA-binding GntR family transcriptional regulator